MISLTQKEKQQENQKNSNYLWSLLLTGKGRRKGRGPRRGPGPKKPELVSLKAQCKYVSCTMNDTPLTN